MGSCIFEVADASQESAAPRLTRDMAVRERSLWCGRRRGGGFGLLVVSLRGGGSSSVGGDEEGGGPAAGVEVIFEGGPRTACRCPWGGLSLRKGGVGFFVVKEKGGGGREGGGI